MSFLSLSSNIVRLRKEKGITQETLAEFVGVTKTSVSKWETGTTTPDIQTLPVLAAFFDVSVDDLLGYEAQLSQHQTRYYYHKLAQEFAERDFEAVWEESMELVKKYYCCYSLLMQMAILWLNHSSLVKSESQKAEVLEWIEKLCNRIIEGCEDSGLCENAAAIRVLVWLQQGRSDLVIDSMEAEVLDVNRIGDKSTLLPIAYLSVGNYSMAEKSSQIGIYRNLMELVNNCILLLRSNREDEEYCRKVIQRTDQILVVFQMEKLHPNVAAGYHYQVALKLCSFFTSLKPDLEEEIYDRIDQYVQMICQLFRDGIKVHSDPFFFRLKDWFSDLELGAEGIRDGQLILSDAVNSLNHPAFSVLQDEKRMKQCIRKLESIMPAGKK